MLVGIAAAAASMSLAAKAVPGIDDIKPNLSYRQRHKAYTKKATSAVFSLPHTQIIDSMTNWQRNQWQRAGGSNDIETLKHYAALKRPSKVKT